MRHLKSIGTLAGAAAVILVLSESANAGHAIQLGQLNLIQFENRENVLDNNTNGTLDAGDQIEGVFSVNGIKVNGVDQSIVPEVAGAFDITVAFVLDASDSSIVLDPSAFSGDAFVLFRPTNDDGSTGRLAGTDAGTAFAMWEGGADVIDTLNDGLADTDAVFDAALDGTLLGNFGFGSNDFGTLSDWGAAGNGYWYSIVEYVAGVVDPTVAVNFYYGLEALSGPIFDVGGGPVGLLNGTLPSSIPSTTLIGDNDSPFGTTPFDLVGRGNQELNTEFSGTSPEDRDKFVFFSNDPARLHPSTPEPGSMILALLGVGCAAPFVRRRRKSKEQAA